MIDTHGFAVVIALTEDALRTVVRGTWHAGSSAHDSGGQGRIPELIELPPGIACAGYAVAGGHVQVPRNELDVRLWPAGNGIELKLGLHMQVAIHSPPVPSAGQFELCADVWARIPLDIGGVDGRQIILRLQDVARSDVDVTLTSGDPLRPRLDALLTEFVARAFEAPDPARPVTLPPDFPHIDRTFGPTELSWLLGMMVISVTIEGMIGDNQDAPPPSISTTHIGDAVAISIPLTLRIFQLRPDIVAEAFDLRNPMAIMTRLMIVVPLETPAGICRARLTTATVRVAELEPAPGPEGANYARNRRRLPLLEGLIQSQIREYSEHITQGLGDVSIGFPTVAEIETLIGDIAHRELAAHQRVAIWTPEVNLAGFAVTATALQALPTMLAIGLNGGEGADLSAVANFITRGHQFAVAISSGGVQQVIAQTRTTYGFADTDLPGRLTVDGKEVHIRALDVFMAASVIRIRGAGAVSDPLRGAFTMGARIRADIELSWQLQSIANANPGQAMCPIIRGKPTIALEVSVAYRVIAGGLALLAFGTLRMIDGLIIVSVVLILWLIGLHLGHRLAARAIAEVLGDMVVWSPNLAPIGQAHAVFYDPVVVEPSGMLIVGDFALQTPDSAAAAGRQDAETSSGAGPAI